MTTRRPLLISVDVGGTLGAADGPGLTMRLVGASPLEPERAREIMRGRLHTEASITDTVVADVCDALHSIVRFSIDRDSFHASRLDQCVIRNSAGGRVRVRSESHHAPRR